MKLVALGMTKYNIVILTFAIKKVNINSSLFSVLFLITSCCFTQGIYEGEHRIKKSQFPDIDMHLLIADREVRQQRFYKEIDNSKVKYITKFKRDKLQYYMTFNSEGRLLNMGFLVKIVDVPADSFTNIQSYLQLNLEKAKIRRIYQEYQVPSEQLYKKTVEEALQNLILPSNSYKLLITAKMEGKRREYDAYFNAVGDLIKIRKSLAVNYDHILY